MDNLKKLHSIATYIAIVLGTICASSVFIKIIDDLISLNILPGALETLAVLIAAVTAIICLLSGAISFLLSLFFIANK